MTPQELAAIVVQRRENLHKEINSYSIIPVDTKNYSKTKDDKKLLYKLKNAWTVKVANGYVPSTYLVSDMRDLGLIKNLF